MKKLACLLLLGFIFTACQSGDAKQENSEATSEEDKLRTTLRAEVMEIHDDAMAKMTTLYELETSIKSLVDSASTEDLKNAEEKIVKLKTAHDDMMTWMKQFKDPKKDMPVEEVKNYFSEQLLSIQKVQTATNTSISEANAYIQSKQ